MPAARPRTAAVKYSIGAVCVVASCCGAGSWNYVRVEGYVADDHSGESKAGQGASCVVPIRDVRDRAAISRLVQDRHPSVRVEFR